MRVAWRAAGLAAGLVATALADPVPAVELTAGAKDCRFAVPQGWSPTTVRWSGACSEGLAEGRGVLREGVAGKVARIFFGSLRAGQPLLGVIDQPGGFVAGRFVAGKALRDGDRNSLILAFDEASAAARQMADGYAQSGQAASAKFYRGKANKLAQQLD